MAEVTWVLDAEVGSRSSIVRILLLTACTFPSNVSGINDGPAAPSTGQHHHILPPFFQIVNPDDYEISARVCPIDKINSYYLDR